MPLYEYGCSACGKIHEVIQKFSDAPLSVCPDCQGPLTKLMSRTSFALKGTGWYTTDYKRKSSSAASSDAKPSGESKPASGENAKPASGESVKSADSGSAPAPTKTPAATV